MQSADIHFRPTGNKHTVFVVKNSTILFETNTRDAFRSSAVFLDVEKTADNETDGTLSVRWSMGKHYGNNIVKCFELALNLKTGVIKAKYEHVHPEHEELDSNTLGVPLEKGKTTSLMFVKLDSPAQKRTSLELLQKFEGRWKLIFNTHTWDHYVDEYPNGCQIAVKVSDGNEDKVQLRNITVEEIS